MLFADFFPRLQARALSRYGVGLSERQFTNWREKGLIPGPSQPIGRGRGLSPERHWPIQAYRRALRLCWYKQCGIDHVPAWWILLWISGEEVSLDGLRASLQRELKRSRRRSRYLADSGYIRSDGATTFEKSPSGQGANPLSLILEDLIKSPSLGFSPELYRDVVKLEFNEESVSEVSQVFQQTIRPLMGHDDTPDDMGVSLTDVWRPGYLSAGDGDYIAASSVDDLMLARHVLSQRVKLMRLVAPFAHLLGHNRSTSVFFVVAITLSKRRFGSRQLIDDLLREIYQIADDRLCGRNPQRRSDFLAANIDAMRCDGEAMTQDEFKTALTGFRQ